MGCRRSKAMAPPVVTLTFDLVTRNLISMCPMVTKTVFTWLFWLLPAVTLTLTFDSKSNRLICESKYICDQHLMKFLSLVFGVHKVFSGRTDSLTDGHPKNRMPPTPKVFGGRGIKCGF